MESTKSARIFLISGVRTAIGSLGGCLNQLSSTELGILASKEVIKRSNIDVNAIGEVYVGAVLTANCGQNIARQIALGSDLLHSTQAVTINKVCSSSMKALSMATMAVRAGCTDAALVVGTESMSKVPRYIQKEYVAYGEAKNPDGVEVDGLVDAILKKKMGECAEKTVKDCEVTREDLDAYAIDSYKKAIHAWKDGLFDNEVLPVSVKQRRGADVTVTMDEELQKFKEEKIPSLRPAFLKNGTITAANASSINDGAVAAIIVSSDYLPEGVSPMAEILDFAEHGVEPVDFTVAPIGAVRKLLAKNNLAKEDIALWEINEAFAITALAFIKELELSPNVVNVKGGAVALGHPLGMSGLRIVISLANSLNAGQLGIAAICNGGGEGMAVLIKKM